MSKLPNSSECGYGPIQYLIDALQRAAAELRCPPPGTDSRGRDGARVQMTGCSVSSSILVSSSISSSKL